MDNEKNNFGNGSSHLGFYGTVAAFSYSILVLHGFLAEKAQKVIEKRLETIREMKKDDQAKNSSNLHNLEKEYQEKSPNNLLTILQMLYFDDKRIFNQAKVD